MENDSNARYGKLKGQLEQLKGYPQHFFLVANANYCKLISKHKMEYYYFNIERLEHSKPGRVVERPVLRRTVKESSEENIMWFLLIHEPILISEEHYNSIARHFNESIHKNE